MGEPGAVRTTCPYCGTGCGVVMSEERDGWAAGGDPSHPANHGKLCSKGMALSQTIGLAGRLLAPEVDGRTVDWETALDATAGRLAERIAADGPGCVAFYVSGQLLTEDYYVANKLLKGFIGSPHIDTNSRLCMASTVAGHKRAFGADVVPGCYEDLDEADLVVLVGSNLAWCHPVLHRRVQAAQRRGCRVVVVDPRRTATCEGAAMHLALAPGSDVALFNGLLCHLADRGALDGDWLGRHVAGAPATLAAARADAPDAAAAARTCGLDARAVRDFYDLFTITDKVVTVFSQGVNQSVRGTDKVNGILNVHLATGRIGRPGAGPFSVTGQPNAMGGREVGGLANQLAAHMDPDDPADVDRVRRFWKAPRLRGGQGLKAVDLFRAVADGRIAALWIMGTNPAVSLPEAARVRDALARCPLVIVSDVVTGTDTMDFAHIRLPAAAWGEKAGTVTNSERRISRQRPFRAPAGESRPDWWIVSQVARRLGHGKAFAYDGPAAIFREHAALSAFENRGRRAFDIGALAELSDKGYDALAPVRWPLPRAASGDGPARMFGAGGFFTADGRARMVPVRNGEDDVARARGRPLLLNTGRYRDQWHTMTRTGAVARLAAHRPEPLLEIHPDDAGAAGLADGAIARVESAHGAVTVRARTTTDQPRGTAFLPIHWTDRFAADAVVGSLVAARVDPYSGQPDSKATPVSVAPVSVRRHGVLLTPGPVDLPLAPTYWCRTAGGGAWVTELADPDPARLDALGATLFADRADLERLDYRDGRRGIARHAWLEDGVLIGALFLGAERPRVSRQWLGALFSGRTLPADDRAVLLAGRAPAAAPEAGPTVCACHGVGRETVRAAIRDGRAGTVAEIGRVLGAGTGCGSCTAELEDIIDGEGGTDDARRRDPAAA